MLGLSKGQRATIVDRLRRNKKYSLLVTSVGGEVDALNYAHDLADALREGGGKSVFHPLPTICRQKVYLSA